MGLLRTILHQQGIRTDLASTRAVSSWDALARRMRGYRTLLMNVRSYTFPMASRAAEIFKALNPEGRVLAGGMHATVALKEMEAVSAMDHICQGPGEGIIADLVRDPARFPRVVQGRGARSMAEWPAVDRTLWPKPAGWRIRRAFHWPLEPACGWGPAPVATILTSRVCPWACAFCSEHSYIPPMGRRPVEAVIDELNDLDRRHGIGSVVIHDSMFFQEPGWLEQWLDLYPRKARKLWPYWAAGRPDTVRRWPDLFEALVRETNWRTISIGFESGSDRVLRLLNKECTADDNQFTIDRVNRLGDCMEREGRAPPYLWANIMLGIPGETRADAFQTMRMMGRMKRAMRSVSFFAPYPGSALGYQLIAEGGSRMGADRYHRFPGDEKVAGVDYAFYRDLLAGRHDEEIRRGAGGEPPAVEPGIPARTRNTWYLFSMNNGRKKLAYGQSPEDALEVLKFRLTEAQMGEIRPDRYETIHPRRLQAHLDQLG